MYIVYSSLYNENVCNTEYTKSGNGRTLAMEKLAQAVEGGGVHVHTLSLFTITYKVAVYAPAERADTLFLFNLYPLYTLSMYSIVACFIYMCLCKHARGHVCVRSAQCLWCICRVCQKQFAKKTLKMEILTVQDIGPFFTHLTVF